MNVLIVGKSGQLANELAVTAPKGYSVCCVGRNDIDVTSFDAINTLVTEFKPSIIINASAYTAVDKAETDVDAAYLLNETAVKQLSLAAKENSARFIHVSTDFIFNGASAAAYCVDDKPDPQGVYGASKLAGEQAVLATYPENSTIVRTSWVYSTFGNNFVKTMLRLMAEKEELGVVADQIGCPTYAKDLANFIWALAKLKTIEPVYHWSDLGVASWYDFAVAIQRIAFEQGLLTKQIPIKPIASSAYPTPAKRPAFSLLNTTQSQVVFAGKHWQEQLNKCLLALS